jgi:hypothetical protein
MFGGARRTAWQTIWLGLAFLVLSLAMPSKAFAFDWTQCVSPSPLAFSSPDATPTLIEIGGGINTAADGNPCDSFDFGLFATNSDESAIYESFSTTSANGVTVTFTFLPCNFDLDPTPGTGGCLPNGAGSYNTYYGVALSSTTETADSVTVYMDPEATGTPTQAIVIPLTITQPVDWNRCVSPSPLVFSSPDATTKLVEIGGGTNTAPDGNTCDAFDRGLFPTNSSEATILQSFSTSSANGVAVTFTYLPCNSDTNPLPGTGGCGTGGAGSLNTSYGVSIGPTTESSDSVTVYMDPGATGTSTQAITIALTIIQPGAGFNWDKCVSPSPLAFSSPDATPSLIEIGGGISTDSDGNTCDAFDFGLFASNSSEAAIYESFSTTSANGVTVTFTFLPCNFDLDPTPGTGGCLPNGAGSYNTYYGVALSATTETADSVTVYMDPEATGTPTQPVTIPLTIDQGIGAGDARLVAKSVRRMRAASAR